MAQALANSMSELLSKLGISQYQGAFEMAGYTDAANFLRMTEADVEELIASTGLKARSALALRKHILGGGDTASSKGEAAAAAPSAAAMDAAAAVSTARAGRAGAPLAASGQGQPPLLSTVYDDWYAEATEALASKARSAKASSSSKGKGTRADQAAAEAKTRSKQLSTTADTCGIRFSGGAFQAEYFESKFERRGRLLFEVLREVEAAEGCGPMAYLSSVAPVTPRPPRLFDNVVHAGQLHVASFGGGPGTDAAGVIQFLHASGLTAAPGARKRAAAWSGGGCGLGGGRPRAPPPLAVSCTLFDYEKTWKRYIATLREHFSKLVLPAVAPAVERLSAAGGLELDFFPCDVTKPILRPQGADDYASGANASVLTCCGFSHEEVDALAANDRGACCNTDGGGGLCLPEQCHRPPAGEPPCEVKLKFDLYIFAYVVHETDDASKAGQYQFYRDIGRLARVGSLLVFCDVCTAGCGDAMARVAAAISAGLAVAAHPPAEGGGRQPAAVLRTVLDRPLLCKSRVLVLRIEKCSDAASDRSKGSTQEPESDSQSDPFLESG